MNTCLSAPWPQAHPKVSRPIPPQASLPPHQQQQDRKTNQASPQQEITHKKSLPLPLQLIGPSHPQMVPHRVVCPYQEPVRILLSNSPPLLEARPSPLANPQDRVEADQVG